MNKTVYYHREPQSYESKIIQWLLGVFGMKKRMLRNVTKNKYPKNPAGIPGSFAKNNNIEVKIHDGRKVWIISPKTAKADLLVIYFHGGAYHSNIIGLHWDFIGELLRHTGATVVVPDYPLAPVNNCEDVYRFIDVVCHDLAQQYPSERWVLMGDSAGAGLALGWAQKLKKEQNRQPEEIILLSPWLDITMSNPDISLMDKADKILSLDALKIAGQQYAGSIPLKDYRVSPIYGDFSGLCPISVFIGTHDVLVVDARKFRQILDAEGVSYHYFEYPGMFHDWMLVTRLKEAKDVIAKIARILDRAGHSG